MTKRGFVHCRHSSVKTDYSRGKAMFSQASVILITGWGRGGQVHYLAWGGGEGVPLRHSVKEPNLHLLLPYSVVDPGFLIIWSKIFRKLRENDKIWTRGARPWCPLYGSFTLHRSGNGTSTGKNGLLYIMLYCSHYTGARNGKGNRKMVNGFWIHFSVPDLVPGAAL